MDNENNDNNAGLPADDSQNGGGGMPGGQNGQGSGAGNPTDELETLKANNRALNKALVDARRGNGNQPQNNGELDPNDPSAQYGLALEVATGKLTRGMEDVFDLYPEVDSAVIKQIRRNPWAYASHDSYINGDVEAAKLEIETYISDLADKSAGQSQNPPVQPANVNANPAPANSEPEPTAPGSDEDTNPMTMPMDKLEKEAAKARAKLARQSK